MIRYVLLLTLAGSIMAADWPSYRGKNRDGISTEKGWDGSFPKSGPKILWTKQAGIGCAAPVSVGGKTILTGNVDNKDIVLALDSKSGKQLWRFQYDCPLQAKMFEGGPRTTPLVDGDVVYTLSWNGLLHCLNLSDGKVKWKVDLAGSYNAAAPKWGLSGPPLIHDGRLYIDIGGTGNSTLCLDAKTGKKVWGTGDDIAGYNQPTIYKDTLIVFKGKGLLGYDLKTGKEKWNIKWRIAYDVAASTPYVFGDKLLVSCGYGSGRTVLYDLSGDKPKELWMNRNIKTKMNTSAVLGDHIYGVSERGSLICAKVKTGEIVWNKDVAGKFGTVIIVNDVLVVLSDKGLLTTAKASPKAYEEISSHQVLDGTCWVSPIYSDGILYVKNNSGKTLAIQTK